MKRTLSLLFLPTFLLIISGCAFTFADYDKINADRVAMQKNVSQLSRRVETLNTQVSSLNSQVSSMNDRVAELNSKNQQLEKQRMELASRLTRLEVQPGTTRAEASPAAMPDQQPVVKQPETIVEAKQPEPEKMSVVAKAPTKPVEVEKKPAATRKPRLKILAGTTDMSTAKSLAMTLSQMGYTAERIDKASKKFKENVVYFGDAFKEIAQEIQDRLGGATQLKPLSWKSIFDIIIVSVNPPQPKATATPPKETTPKPAAKPTPEVTKPAPEAEKPPSAIKTTPEAEKPDVGTKPDPVTKPEVVAMPAPAVKPTPEVTKPPAGEKVKVKVLTGTGDMFTAQRLAKQLYDMGYVPDKIDKAPRTNFKYNVVYYAKGHKETGEAIRDSLGGKTELKLLSWRSVYDIIVVSGRER